MTEIQSILDPQQEIDSLVKEWPSNYMVPVPFDEFDRSMWITNRKNRLDLMEWRIRKEEYMLKCSINIPLLFAAVNYGYLDIIQALFVLDPNCLHAKYSMKYPGYEHHIISPLHEAVQHGQIKIVEWILSVDSSMIDLKRIDLEMGTPLHIASRIDNVPMVDLLFRFGSKSANTSSTSNPLSTPLRHLINYYYYHLAFSVERNVAAIATTATTATTLRVFGAKVATEIYTAGNITDLPFELIQALTEPITEEIIHRVNQRVFFASSLTHRLLVLA